MTRSPHSLSFTKFVKLTSIAAALVALFGGHAAAPAATIQVDLGLDTYTPASGWNALGFSGSGPEDPITDATDSNGNPTPVDIEWTGDLDTVDSDAGDDGMAGTDFSGDLASYPDSVLFDSPRLKGPDHPDGAQSATVIVGGLPTGDGRTYDFTFAATYLNGYQTRNATTEWTIGGQSTTLLATGNWDSTASITGVSVTPDQVGGQVGTIEIDVAGVPTTGDEPFTWFNAMKIDGDYSEVPEPASAALCGLGALVIFGGRRRRPR